MKSKDGSLAAKERVDGELVREDADLREDAADVA